MKEMNDRQRRLLKELVESLDGEYRMQCCLDVEGHRFMRVFIEWDKGCHDDDLNNPKPEREGTL